MDKERVKNIVKQMKALKDVPFNLIIECLSGYKIIPFDSENKNDIAILELLKKTAALAGKEINKKGINSKRPNEVGNKIEPFIKNALTQLGYEADIPKTKSGKKQSAGYPDISFYDKNGEVIYLECKIYSADTFDLSMRSFSVSSSETSKILCDAHHFLISFEMYKHTETIFKTRNYKIISLEDLKVNVKHEFNANNIALYKEVLASGKIEV